MFTGIVEEIGKVRELFQHRLSLGAEVTRIDAKISQSISVNGVCLTIVELTPEGFIVDLSEETLERTNLGSLEVGVRVNLERPLRADDRLGGHFVQGHIDATGTVTELAGHAFGRTIQIEMPDSIARYVVEKGFIAIDGVSLTVTEAWSTAFKIAVIPYTWDNTIIQYAKVGDKTNLEVDVLAKYVERLRLE